MTTRLLSVLDVKSLVESQGPYNGSLLLCTIVEPLEAAEEVRKGMWLGVDAFLAGWKSFKQYTYRAPLDDRRLVRSLFEREDGKVLGLWPGARRYDSLSDNGEQEIPPYRTVRRLIMRPSEEDWCPNQAEAYEEMESRPDRPVR